MPDATTYSPGQFAIAEALDLDSAPATTTELMNADPDRIDENAYKELKRMAGRGLVEQVEGKRWQLTDRGRQVLLASRAAALLLDERQDAVPRVQLAQTVEKIWKGGGSV